MTGQAHSLELRRAVRVRTDRLREIVEHLKGPVSETSTLRRALQTVAEFTVALDRVAEDEWERNSDPLSRTSILQPLLRHLNDVADFVEEYLGHGTRQELSHSLIDQVREELNLLNVGHYGVVLAHGPSNNFTTAFGDVAAGLFGRIEEEAPDELWLALFKVPRIEGIGVAWRPVLIGHEVAHVAVHEHDLVARTGLLEGLDLQVARRMKNPRGPEAGAPAARGFYEIAAAWTTEVLCDLHALDRFGPAAVAAIAEYFTSLHGHGELSPTHPPTELRLRLMLDTLGMPASARLQTVLEPWIESTPRVPTFDVPWADHLAKVFLTAREGLWEAIQEVANEHHDPARGADLAEGMADALAEGLPGGHSVDADEADGATRGTMADIVNAVWIARSEDVDTPVDALAKKAIESIDFVSRWEQAGGVVPGSVPQTTAVDDHAEAGALSAASIAHRLAAHDRRLVISPRLQEPRDAGIDLRLGNRFIVFQRSTVTAFDALDEGHDPRRMQTETELSWTENFILHPQEMVLGSTLEYLALPSDLTAQVITRSSYGRLGLLSATAVQVHPGFRGCLTLELVNLSTVPLSLTPGERIAQLVLWTLTEPTVTTPATSSKYRFPTGPQFSRARYDPEAMILHGIG